MTDQLKPCPFCGGEAMLFTVIHPSVDGESYHVACTDDDCEMESRTNNFDSHDKSEAIRIWSTRHVPESYVLVKVDLIERLIEDLESWMDTHPYSGCGNSEDLIEEARKELGSSHEKETDRPGCCRGYDCTNGGAG